MSRPTPSMLASSGSEDGHQAALFCAIADDLAAGIIPAEAALMYAIPNGGARGDNERSNKIRGGKLKQTGVKRGVPDTHLPVAMRGYLSLYIELKRPKSDRGRAGKANEEQNEWHDNLRAQGHCVLICIGWEQAYKAVRGYLAGEKTQLAQKSA